MHSLMNRAREPRRIREDPVAFLLNVGLFYQGTVMKDEREGHYIWAVKLIYFTLYRLRVGEVTDITLGRNSTTRVFRTRWKKKFCLVEKVRRISSTLARSPSRCFAHIDPNVAAVQNAIDLLAERQAHLLVDSSSIVSDKKRVANLQRKRKTFKRELEAVAKAIADKCFSRMDDIRLLRFFAFTINNILVRLYHQGIHIKESEWMEVRFSS